MLLLCCDCGNESASHKTERGINNRKKLGGRGYEKGGWGGVENIVGVSRPNCCYISAQNGIRIIQRRRGWLIFGPLLQRIDDSVDFNTFDSSRHHSNESIFTARF